MKIRVERPGALTTVQDAGRWGHQGIGMPVCGAMDAPALTRGNLLLGNDPGAAALEVTLMGPTLVFQDGEGTIAITGGDLSPKLNGVPVPQWTVLSVASGDTLSFGAPKGRGCRAYICVGGGIDVPLVMGSRSTYVKAGIGGFEGRALKSGDVLPVGTPWILWKKTVGISCPHELQPDYAFTAPLRAVLGPQDSYITPQGIKTFFETEYKISPSADRMGYRMESDAIIEHVKGPDIISDGIPMGAIQIPGQGVPIVMMADRQTTGGYVKIAVLHALDVARLSQRLPGSPVRFACITQEEGIAIAKGEAKAVEELRLYVRSQVAGGTHCPSQGADAPSSGAMDLSVNGTHYSVTWEKMQ
ncbi:MAG: biotin-dependent carboxyltransferase family protein [Pyramidobacter sp.]|nr:biotin-dependent carboxyltransferase family protein [Pyramidobacter sp.]